MSVPKESKAHHADPETGRRYTHFSESSCGVKQRKRHFHALDPDSRFVEVWDVMFLLLLVACAIFTPMDVAFDLSNRAPGAILAVLCVVDIIFLLDLILQFVTAYHERMPSSRYVKDFRKIAQKYITGWFLIDLVSSLPYQFLPQWPALRLLRLLRLHRATRIVRQHQHHIGISFAALSLAKFWVVLIFTCHWIACIWASIAWHAPKGSWLEALESNKGGPSDLYSTWWNVYSISVYWAIMTLTSIGYGDITPQNGWEYVVASCCMAFLSSMWAVVIGQMCGVLATLLPHDVAFKRTMDDLNWMMRDRKMPQGLRSKLRRYFWESRSLNRLMEQRSIIERMSPMLQGVVARQLSEHWLSKVPYLQALDQESLVAVARCLTPGLFAPNEAVQAQRALFLVRRGVAMHGGRVLVAGSLWGEDMLVSNEALRDTCSVRCLTYLEVLTLRYADLKNAVQTEKSRRAIRKWQIHLALSRAILIIARQVGQMQQRDQVLFHALSGDERSAVVRRWLRGDKSIVQRQSTICGTALSESLSGPSMLVSNEELASMRQAILSLTNTVEHLQQTVLEMSHNH